MFRCYSNQTAGKIVSSRQRRFMYFVFIPKISATISTSADFVYYCLATMGKDNPDILEVVPKLQEQFRKARWEEFCFRCDAYHDGVAQTFSNGINGKNVDGVAQTFAKGFNGHNVSITNISFSNHGEHNFRSNMPPCQWRLMV